MAFGQRNQFKLSISPLVDGPLSNSDEETVQSMWNCLHNNYPNEFQQLEFKNLNYQQSLKGAVVLKIYVCFTNSG